MTWKNEPRESLANGNSPSKCEKRTYDYFIYLCKFPITILFSLFYHEKIDGRHTFFMHWEANDSWQHQKKCQLEYFSIDKWKRAISNRKSYGNDEGYNYTLFACLKIRRQDYLSFTIFIKFVFKIGFIRFSYENFSLFRWLFYETCQFRMSYVFVKWIWFRFRFSFNYWWKNANKLTK